eukprot:1124864-Pleurochrysis_carterae.AAC.1
MALSFSEAAACSGAVAAVAQIRSNKSQRKAEWAGLCGRRAAAACSADSAPLVCTHTQSGGAKHTCPRICSSESSSTRAIARSDGGGGNSNGGDRDSGGGDSGGGDSGGSGGGGDAVRFVLAPRVALVWCGSSSTSRVRTRWSDLRKRASASCPAP